MNIYVKEGCDQDLLVTHTDLFVRRYLTEIDSDGHLNPNFKPLRCLVKC